MNPYTSIATAAGSWEALELATRLTAWHDAMVIHQRRARDSPCDECGPDCPHAEAQALWLEALETFGDRAYSLEFLRDRGSVPTSTSTVTPHARHL